MRLDGDRRWVPRPTNDGYTAPIDPAGRIVDQLPPFEPVTGPLRFNWINEQTVYKQFGDWFARLCLAGGVAGYIGFAIREQQ